MKYSHNTLKFSHILTENLKPIPVHHLQKIRLRQHSGQTGSCASMYLKTCHLTYKMDGEYALAALLQALTQKVE